MSTNDSTFRIPLRLKATPQEVFESIRRVRGWWSGNLEGDTRTLGEEFTYDVPGVHFCRMRISESIPGESIVWDVLESRITYIRDPSEWAGTRIRFSIDADGEGARLEFVHEGLEPEIECFKECSNAWGLLVRGNLARLIETGEDQPNAFAV